MAPPSKSNMASVSCPSVPCYHFMPGVPNHQRFISRGRAASIIRNDIGTNLENATVEFTQNEIKCLSCYIFAW
jgi:hypothetical protein